jgi:hypothetical protein
MMGTIIRKSRPMMLDSNLADTKWAEATETALYLHASSPTTSLENCSPCEIMHGEALDLSHPQWFGHSANQLITKE